jgi:sulfatase maturation enzyme AslB (radical SAM superfamily)
MEWAVKQQEFIYFEHRVKKRWSMAEFSSIPLLNVDGSLREWVGVHTDITERKQQQQYLQKAISLSQHNLFSSMIAILKGRYDYRNCKRCYYQNLGQGKNIIGKSLLSIMPEIIEQGNLSRCL